MFVKKRKSFFMIWFFVENCSFAVAKMLTIFILQM